MEYTLKETYDYILELSDKKGSDMFQLPYVVNTFQTATLDFIRERIPLIESTQMVTADLQKLADVKKLNVANSIDDPYVVRAIVPNDSMYVFRVKPIYKGGVTSRRSKLVRFGNVDALITDPHNKPTRDYPMIVQYKNYITINSGHSEKALNALVTYIKKPNFAKNTEPTKKIVDLPDQVIEDIIKKVVFELTSSKADERTNINYQKAQGFGKINQ